MQAQLDNSNPTLIMQRRVNLYNLSAADRAELNAMITELTDDPEMQNPWEYAEYFCYRGPAMTWAEIAQYIVDEYAE